MIAIVTDSSAGISREDAKEWGISIVPMTYTADEKQFFEDYIGKDRNYEDLIEQDDGELRTSQSSIRAFTHIFRYLLGKGYDILCLSISSRLSGTYNNACVAARNLDEEKAHIRVVDSRTTSGGLFLLAREAKRKIQNGATLEEAAAYVHDIRSQMETHFTVKDMAPLRRSGRLGVVRQSVGTILNIRPLLAIKNGCVVATGTVRGNHEKLRALEKLVPAEAREVIVNHLKNDSEAEKLAMQLKKRHSTVLIRPIGPVLGIHLGVGSIGVSWHI